MDKKGNSHPITPDQLPTINKKTSKNFSSTAGFEHLRPKEGAIPNLKEGQAKGPGTFITEATTNFTVPIKRGSNTQSRTDLLADTLGKLKQKNLINPYTQKTFALSKSHSMFGFRGVQSKKSDPDTFARLTVESSKKKDDRIKTKNLDSEANEEIKNNLEDAQQKIKEIYEEDDQDKINSLVDKIESIDIVKHKIAKFQVLVNNKVKDYNKLYSQFEEKEKQLALCAKQEHNLAMQIGAIMPLSDQLKAIEEEVKRTQNEVNMEGLQSSILNHVIGRDKLDIICLKQPITENKKAIKDIDMTLESMGQLKERNQTKTHSIKTVFKQQKEEEQYDTRVIWQRSLYIQDVCRKKIFDMVYDNQKKQIEEKDRKSKQDKLDETKKKDFEKKQKEDILKKEIDQAFWKNAQQMENMLKMKKETNIKGIFDLKEYHETLDTTQIQLLSQKQLYESMRDEKEKRLKDMHDKLEKLKFQRKQSSSVGGEDEINLVELGVNTKDVFIDEEKEKIQDAKNLEFKKAKKAIALVNTCITRICHQLKEEQNLSKQGKGDKSDDIDYVKILSICGLRLEHMVATLYKKKPTFNIESVNTDFSSDLPPYFLGIKFARYVEAEKEDKDEGNDLQKIWQHNVKEDKDEEKEKKHMEALREDIRLKESKIGGEKGGAAFLQDGKQQASQNKQSNVVWSQQSKRPDTQASKQTQETKTTLEKKEKRKEKEHIQKLESQHQGQVTQIDKRLNKMVQRTKQIFDSGKKQDDMKNMDK